MDLSFDLSFIEKLDLDTGGIFIIMVGPPGAGKTSISKELESKYHFMRVCPDDIREEFSGDAADQSNNEQVFAKVYSRLSFFLKEGYNVVYDATNCRTTYRMKILDTVKDCANYILCLCLTTSIGDCLERNKNRYERHVPEDVIERMYFTLKKHPPTIFEGYDAIVGF